MAAPQARVFLSFGLSPIYGLGRFIPCHLPFLFLPFGIGGRQVRAYLATHIFLCTSDNGTELPHALMKVG